MSDKKIAVDVYRIIEAVIAGLIVALLTNIVLSNRALSTRFEENAKNIKEMKEGGDQLTISVLPHYIHNNDVFPIEVSGYPIELMIDMKEIFGSDKSRFVHLFQRETGGQVYSYQDSFPFTPNSTTTAKIWLGGTADINKTYQVVAIINENQKYQKNAQNIYQVDTLPGSPKAGVTLTRKQ